ncbi:aminoglycoside phosphotransferase family protein [Streptomyces sp. NPDC001941]|uniref:aminoglycoside phosphotransferase family protein n=1 Tax=Streptomyces sp. NPDC001941 TaxID=3154659 RepID=UPI003331B28F
MTSEDAPRDHPPHHAAVRVGDTVRRPAQPWTPAVHALLKHLESVGFPYAPRVFGYDDQGREVLAHIEGEAGSTGWARVVDDQGLCAFARLLRDYHEATVGFSPPEGAVWAEGVVEVAGQEDEQVVCHGDFGPWNVLWQGRRPVGVVDWDFARPAPRLHDVAFALEYAAPFRDDGTCVRSLGFERAPDRRRRVELFCAAYGLNSVTGIADAVIDRQRGNLRRVRRLAAEGHEPQAGWVRDGLLPELTRRLAWSRGHRHLFE